MYKFSSNFLKSIPPAIVVCPPTDSWALLFNIMCLKFELLKYLAERNGRIQTREVLLEQVWDYNNSVTTRTVDTHIKRLRSKIGDVGSKIETVRGVGYRFNYVV